MNGPPKGISNGIMWDRMVKAERRAKRGASVGTKFKIGNPIGVGDLVAYGATALVAGVAEGKGWLPQAWNVGGMAVDTRLVTALAIVGANMIKPVKNIIAKIPLIGSKKIQGAIVVVQATSYARTLGRNIATKF